MLKVGILNLQGAFSKHKKILNKLGVKSIYVNKTSHLKHCSGLIIPGGESTTLSTLINKDNKTFGLITLPKSYVDFNDSKEINCATDVKNEIINL